MTEHKGHGSDGKEKWVIEARNCFGIGPLRRDALIELELELRLELNTVQALLAEERAKDRDPAGYDDRRGKPK